MRKRWKKLTKNTTQWESAECDLLGLATISMTATTTTTFTEPKTAELLAEQSEDPLCRQLVTLLEDQVPTIPTNAIDSLFLNSIEPLSIQRYRNSFRDRYRHSFLHAYHYPWLDAQHAERGIYDTKPRRVYWLPMTSDVYTTVTDCRQCTHNRANKTRTRNIKFFSAGGPLDFIAMDELGPLRKTTSGNLFGVIMTDRYSNLARAVPNSKTSAKELAAIIWNNGVLIDI